MSYDLQQRFAQFSGWAFTWRWQHLSWYRIAHALWFTGCIVSNCFFLTEKLFLNKLEERFGKDLKIEDVGVLTDCWDDIMMYIETSSVTWKSFNPFNPRSKLNMSDDIISFLRLVAICLFPSATFMLVYIYIVAAEWNSITNTRLKYIK